MRENFIIIAYSPDHYQSCSHLFSVSCQNRPHKLPLTYQKIKLVYSFGFQIFFYHNLIKIAEDVYFTTLIFIKVSHTLVLCAHKPVPLLLKILETSRACLRLRMNLDTGKSLDHQKRYKQLNKRLSFYSLYSPYLLKFFLIIKVKKLLVKRVVYCMGLLLFQSRGTA